MLSSCRPLSTLRYNWSLLGNHTSICHARLCFVTPFYLSRTPHQLYILNNTASSSRACRHQRTAWGWSWCGQIRTMSFHVRNYLWIDFWLFCCCIGMPAFTQPLILWVYLKYWPNNPQFCPLITSLQAQINHHHHSARRVRSHCCFCRGSIATTSAKADAQQPHRS